MPGTNIATGQCTTSLIFVAGNVHYVNERGKTAHALTTESSVQKLLFMEKDVLVVITETLLLSLHKISLEGEAEEVMKVRNVDSRAKSLLGAPASLQAAQKFAQMHCGKKICIWHRLRWNCLSGQLFC